jgi:hypothetical protein
MVCGAHHSCVVTLSSFDSIVGLHDPAGKRIECGGLLRAAAISIGHRRRDSRNALEFTIAARTA